MKTDMSIFTLAIVLSFFSGVFAQNNYRSYKQPDGTTFSAIERGEEFLQFFETPEGYIVRSGTDGYFYYFDINAQGEFVQTGIKAGTKNPLNVRSKPYNDPAAKAALIKQIEEYNRAAERNRERNLARQRKWLAGYNATKENPPLAKITMDETSL